MRSWMRARAGRIAGALTALGVLAVAGCGSSGSSAGADTGGSSSGGGTVELTFWNGFTGPDRAAVEHTVEGFNSSQSKVHVTMQITPWDSLYQKLLPAFGAGKGPDMVGMDSNQIPVYASKKAIQPLTEVFADGGVDRSTVVGPAVDAGTYGGKVYGVPLENTPLLLYYNKKLFSAAGLDPAAPPTTWDEWAADAKKLTKGAGPGGKPSQYGLALGVHDTVELLPILMRQADGGLLSDDGTKVLLDSDGSKQAIRYWADLVAQQHISPVGLSGADADKLMQSGTAAMEVNGPWATTGYKQAGIDYGLAMVPTGPNGKQVTLGNTTSLAVSARADDTKVKAADAFYAYWVSQDAQTYFSLHTGFPPVVNNLPASALAANPDVTAFSKYAEDATGLAPGQANFAAIQGEVFDPTMEKILNDPSTLDATLTAAAKNLSGLVQPSS